MKKFMYEILKKTECVWQELRKNNVKQTQFYKWRPEFCMEENKVQCRPDEENRDIVSSL